MDPDVKQKNKYLPILITALVALVFVAAASAGTWYYMNKKAQKAADDSNQKITELQKQMEGLKTEAKTSTTTPSVTGSTAASNASTVISAEDALKINAIMKSFTSNIQYTGGASYSAKTVSVMTEQLSQTLKNKLTSEYGNSFALLLGIQDTPDNGYLIGVPTGAGSSASVNVEFKYTGGNNLQKKFTLIKVNGAWFIDAIANL
jgi:flagellar basal body-associated protein FliL